MRHLPRPHAPPARTERAGWLVALGTGFRGITLRVQRMHHAIAGRTFRVLRWVPVASGPARVVQAAHDTIADGVYAAVRHGGAATLAAAAAAERRLGPAADAGDDGGRLAAGLRSALNGAFGDHLAATGNPLAVEMGLHAAGGPVALTPQGVRAAVGPPTGRLAVFVHGLGCDERCWHPAAAAAGEPGTGYGARLRRELGFAPLYLRYNTGLPLHENGRALAGRLDALLAAYPGPPPELVLIGHSMGGLVARSACAHAAAAGLPWLARTRMVICLGSPHRGAPLEQAGRLAAAALGWSDVSAPLGELADARSAGVRDLRHGLRAMDGEGMPPEVAGIPCRSVGATLHRDADHLLGRLLGDGLVTPGSATGVDGWRDAAAVRLGGLGHMRLLDDPRVYAQLRAWLADG